MNALHFEAELTKKEMDYLLTSIDEVSPRELGEKVLPDYRRHRQNVITKTGMLTPDGYKVLSETRWEVFEKLASATQKINSITVKL